MSSEIDEEEVDRHMGTAGARDEHKIAAYLHWRLTDLMTKYHERRLERTWFNDLSKQERGAW